MRLRESITRRLPLKVPVTPTFSGLRIGEGERVPEALRGRVISWMRVWGLNKRIACFLDEHDEPVMHEGRRIQGIFRRDRDQRVARGLLEREILRRFESDELELRYSSAPRGTSRWWTLLAALLFLGIFLVPAIAGIMSLVDYFRGLPDFEPLSVRIMLGVIGAALALVWPVMFITFVFAVRAHNRLCPRDLALTAAGLTAILPEDRLIEKNWAALHRIESSRLVFNDKSSVQLPRDDRFLAVARILRRRYLQQTGPSPARACWLIAVASIIIFLLALTPLVVLLRAGYLDQADIIRMSAALGGMIGLLFVPLMIILFASARADAKRSRQP